jgi:hypothetical protein
MTFKHKSNNDGRFSDAIWGDLPEEIKFDPTVGIYRVEDFANFGVVRPVASNIGYYVGKAGPYVSFEDTGNAIVQDPTALGRLKITVDSDNDETNLQSNSGVGVLGKISTTAPRKLWFETRIATAQIATQNLFVGLMEEGVGGVTGAISDAGVIADKDYIGFQVAEGAASTVTFTYRKAGQTAQTPISSLHTLAADTFVNLGFVYEPGINPAQRIRVYVNGVRQGTYVTQAQVAAATFPNGEELAFTLAVSNAAASRTYYCEGWQFAQLY